MLGELQRWKSCDIRGTPEAVGRELRLDQQPGSLEPRRCWRDASALISGIRDQHDHDLEWYLSGNEGVIDERVERALAEHGWRPQIP